MNASRDELVYSREPAGSRGRNPGTAGSSASAEVLTPLALQLLASLHRRFNARRLELLAARARRQTELDAGALPRFPAGDRRDARRRLAHRTGARGPARPARRDHRSRRPQDGHQRAERAGALLHGGLRGLLLADLGEHRARAGQPGRRHPPHDQLRGSGDRQGLSARGSHRDADRAPARLASAGEARAHQRRGGVGRAVRFRGVPRQQPRGAGAATAPGRTSICRSWRATSRRGCGTTCSSPPRMRSACRAAPSRRRC